MAKLRVNKIAAVGVSTETTGSVFFDGSGDHLAFTDSTDYDLGISNEAFSLEFWFYKLSAADTFAQLGLTRGGGTAGWNGTDGHSYLAFQNTDNKIYWQWWDGSAQREIVSTETPAINTWHHLAIQYDGTTTRGYLNGIEFDSATQGYAKPSSSNITRIGQDASGSTNCHAYISNLRVCKGHQVYNSNFTPPTEELDVHSESILLVCHDGENIFADKTGRHTGEISAIGDRLSSPTPTATDSPIGITTFNPGLTRSVDATAGPTFEGGVGYNSQNWLTLPKGTTEQRGNDRGVFGGGENPSANNVIQFVNMSSQGTSQDFGDLVRTQMDMGATGSRTRGLFAGGDETTAPLVEENTIQFITISTQGNASDYGDLTGRRKNIMGGGTSTRGVFGGGSNASDHHNNIDYVTIATLGNAQDFGDLDKKPGERGASQVTGSPTRGIFYIKDNSINYITWATLGNALDFGDTDNNSGGAGAVGDTTRSCMHGTTVSYNNSIEYITISTLGNGQDFGDLIVAMRYQYGASNPTRGVMAGQADPAINNINFITIQTTGNAQDFGDLNTGQSRGIGLSGCHGGIS